MRALGLALSLSLLASACGGEELPGELFEGRLEASSTVLTPLSQRPACVAGVASWTRSGATAKGSSMHHRPTPRWAPGAALVVDGERLELVGEAGEPRFPAQGDTWRWDPSRPREVPHALRGWGLDSTLDALTDASIEHRYTHVEATEKYASCGSTLELRATREGDKLVLVDANPTRGANALAFFGKLAAGFLVFLVLPIVALIAFVIRRARRRG